MKRLLTAFLVLFSLQAYGSGLENNIRFISTDADVTNDIIENVFLPSTSYKTPIPGRLYTLKIDKNGDRLISAQVLAYLINPAGLGVECDGEGDLCDLVITDVYESTSMVNGLPVLPDFGGQILIGSALHPIFFNQLVGGCDVIYEFGQSNSVGVVDIDSNDVPDNYILQWTRAGQSSPSTSELIVSDGGIDAATVNSPHTVGIGFTFAKQWLAYQLDDSNIDHLIRTGGSVRPICIISMGANSTGHKYNGTGYWGANFGDFVNGGRSDFVNHGGSLLNSAAGVQPLVALYSQMEWETRTTQASGGNSIEAWPDNVKDMWEYLVQEVPELSTVKLMYFNMTEACGAGSVGGSWPNCATGYKVVAGTLPDQVGNGGADDVNILEDILDNAHFVEATSAPNGTGVPGNLIHFTAEGQRVRAQAGFIKWLEVTGRDAPSEAVPGTITTFTLTPSSGVIDFSWDADIAGIPADTQYYLKVSGPDDPGFSSPIFGATRCAFQSNCLTMTSQQISGLTNESTYYAEVQGVNSSIIDDDHDGGPGWGPVTSGNTDPFYPAPANVTLTEGDTVIIVGWDAVDNADGYFVQCDDTSNSFGSIAYPNPDVKCTIGGGCTVGISEPATGLANGTEHWCRVQAHDGAPNNVWGRYSTTSSPASATPTATPEPAVVGLTATDGDDQQTTITWTSVQGSATEFKCQVDDDSNFLSPEFNQDSCTPTVNCPTTDPINTGQVLTNATPYFVQCAAWSAAQGFGDYTQMTSPISVTPVAPGASPFAVTYALPGVVVHYTQDVNMDCGSGVGTCNNGNLINAGWHSPGTIPPGTGEVGRPEGRWRLTMGGAGRSPLNYLTGGLAQGSGFNIGMHWTFVESGEVNDDGKTTMFSTGHTRIVYFDLSADAGSSSNILSFSGADDVLWLSGGAICLGDSQDTNPPELCSSVDLPFGAGATYVVHALHNGLTGGSAKAQLIVYDVGDTSDKTGVCSAYNGQGAADLDNPRVLCTVAEGGYWAWERTGTNSDLSGGQEVRVTLSAWASSVDGNTGADCDNCLHRAGFVTTDGGTDTQLTGIAADQLTAPTISATILGVISELDNTY